MAIQDFTGKNIQDTYQRVVQTDGTNLADGTGSLLPISFNGNNVIISGSLTAQTYVVSESIIAVTSGSTMFGNSSDDTHQMTGSLNVSGTIEALDQIKIDKHLGTAAGLYINGDGVVYYPLTPDNESGEYHLHVGNANRAVTMSAALLNIDASFGLDIDCNAGPVYFADSGVRSVLIHTTQGYISASGYITTGTHITASGNISASGVITGTVKGGKF